jgi:membrane-associated protease RseP (regulator of RpoE activity)
MPASHPDLSDSPPPSVTRSAEAPVGVPPPTQPRAGSSRLVWRTNAWLFLATVASVFVTSYGPNRGDGRALADALQFTSSLLGILLAHEFGHYIAARIHKVDASLPFFIPMPLVSPFGTMGAVIRMRSIIPTRRALLDIGAAGPLAGLALCLPLYAWGAHHSQVVPLSPGAEQGLELGDSLLLRLLDRLFGPPVPDGMDLLLSPVAFAAWAGLFVTMINLIPVGQLDGGHVAFSLFGPRQNRIAQWVHRSMLVFFFVSVASFVLRDLRSGFGLWRLGHHVNNSLFWLLWFEILAVLGWIAQPRSRPTDKLDDGLGVRTRLAAIFGLVLIAAMLRDERSIMAWVAWFVGLGVLLLMEARWGSLRASSPLLDHPATGAQPLGRGRAAIAVLTLAFFVLLFMPTPISL